MKQRLQSLENTLRRLNGGRCPMCFGTDGKTFTPRVLIKDSAAPPRQWHDPDCYDDTNHCRRCGAEAKNIILLIPGTIERGHARENQGCRRPPLRSCEM